MRIDTLSTSIITSPALQKAILLDHLKKEAVVLPLPPPQAAPSSSGSPQSPAGAVAAPPMQVQDLGKSTIEGHEVEGKRFVLTPPALPQIPQLPQMPKAPKPPQPGAQPPTSPQAPEPPQPPKPPQPSVTEVWTSVKLKMPVLTKVTTAAGEQTTYCKPTSTEEPHPSLFEIPPGYKLKKS